VKSEKGKVKRKDEPHGGQQRRPVGVVFSLLAFHFSLFEPDL